MAFPFQHFWMEWEKQKHGLEVQEHNNFSGALEH
jgi:hypothetical protein